MAQISWRDKTRDKQQCTETAALPASLCPMDREDFVPTEEAVYDLLSPVHQVAARLAASFRSEAESIGHTELPWGVIDHGFSVCATGITKCTFAYERYLAQSGLVGSTDDLLKALRSPKTIRFFTYIADMTNTENREYETYFNLRGNFGHEDYDEFVFDATSSCFVPEATLRRHADAAALSARVDLLSQQGVTQDMLGACPAIHLIPTVWNKTLDACIEEGLISIG